MTIHARPYPYAESRRNKQLMALREDGPLFTEELPSGARFSPQARRYVGSIRPPWGRGESVWYLWGDERRSVRRFVDQYTDEVRTAMNQKNSALSSRIDDALWQIICEEYCWEFATIEERQEIAKKQKRVRSKKLQDEIDQEKTSTDE